MDFFRRVESWFNAASWEVEGLPPPDATNLDLIGSSATPTTPVPPLYSSTAQRAIDASRARTRTRQGVAERVAAVRKLVQQKLLLDSPDAPLLLLTQLALSKRRMCCHLASVLGSPPLLLMWHVVWMCGT
jgi:hypothetical protein